MGSATGIEPVITYSCFSIAIPTHSSKGSLLCPLHEHMYKWYVCMQGRTEVTSCGIEPLERPMRLNASSVVPTTSTGYRPSPKA